eukprot:TRINITY_DN30481_c0_g1_i1.p1 TRINITY_DN30481_c0_g1~~TRINITY_DN30481_c0_g1_i1.p1  ORF type:complete len:344 (+),score=139.99 TRINITY_DN30481_c0_g1_i1:56-1033(+)
MAAGAAVSLSMAEAAYHKGMQYYDKERYHDALKKVEEASAIYGQCDEGDPTLLGSILLALGSCHQQLQSFETALKFYEACVSALQADGSADENQGIVSPLVNMGLLYFRSGDPGRAMAKLKRAQSIVEKQLSTDRMTCADLYHNIGVVHDHQHELQKALQYYSKSLRVREKFEETREQQLLLALTKENVAMVWRDQDNQTEAIKLMNSILPVRKRYNGVESAEYGNSLFNLGLLHFDLGRISSALTYFTKCHELRAALFGASSPQTKLCAKYVAALENSHHRIVMGRPGTFACLPDNLTPRGGSADASRHSTTRRSSSATKQPFR